MPITIQYQPQASAIANAAIIGGQGDYRKWLNQYLNNQYQFGMNVGLQQQQMAMNRMNALSQLAAQAQQQASQQNFELQRMPYQAMLQAQEQAYQTQLGMGADANRQALASQYADQASARDFAEQQQLQEQRQAQQQRLDAAHMDLAGQNQQALAAYNAQLKQQQQVEALFQNPLQQFLQNTQKAQQAGYSFTPEDQQTSQRLQNEIRAIQDSVNSGQNTRGTVMGELQKRVAQLNAITPNQPPPPSTADRLAKSVVMGIPGPDGNPLPGTENTPFTVDQKDGTPMVLRGWKADQSGGEAAQVDVDGVTVPIKVANEMATYKQKLAKMEQQKNEAIEKRINQMKMGDAAFMSPDPNMRATSPFSNPQYEEQLRQRFRMEAGAAEAAAEQRAAPVEQEARSRMPPAQNTSQQPVDLQRLQTVTTPQEAQAVIQQFQQARQAGQQISTRELILLKQAILLMQQQRGAA